MCLSVENMAQDFYILRYVDNQAARRIPADTLFLFYLP